MTEQPKALRLADILQHRIPSIECLERAAAELRRLHEVNAELLEALNWIAAHDLRGADLKACGLMAYGLVHKARAAIAKAEQKTHRAALNFVHQALQDEAEEPKP
jgi:hypothetical protein